MSFCQSRNSGEDLETWRVLLQRALVWGLCTTRGPSNRDSSIPTYSTRGQQGARSQYRYTWGAVAATIVVANALSLGGNHTADMYEGAPHSNTLSMEDSTCPASSIQKYPGPANNTYRQHPTTPSLPDPEYLSQAPAALKQAPPTAAARRPYLFNTHMAATNSST